MFCLRSGGCGSVSKGATDRSCRKLTTMAGTNIRIHNGDRKMPSISLITLYVNAPQSSAAFYQELVRPGADPVFATFVMFGLPEGAGLGLWSRHTVVPPRMLLAVVSSRSKCLMPMPLTNNGWSAGRVSRSSQPMRCSAATSWRLTRMRPSPPGSLRRPRDEERLGRGRLRRPCPVRA